MISAASPFNVTAKESNTLVVTVTDADNDETTLWLQTVLPPGATFDNTTGEFVWTPANTDAVNLTWVYNYKGVFYVLLKHTNWCVSSPLTVCNCLTCPHFPASCDFLWPLTNSWRSGVVFMTLMLVASLESLVCLLYTRGICHIIITIINEMKSKPWGKFPSIFNKYIIYGILLETFEWKCQLSKSRCLLSILCKHTQKMNTICNIRKWCICDFVWPQQALCTFH